MAVNESVLRLVRAFQNREINDFNLYIEGFGGIKISRTKDGLVSLFTDKNMRLGNDDHFTVFLNEHELKGLHRKVTDAETDVYMRYNVDYVQSPEGIRKLVQDMQERHKMSFFMKALLLVLYRAVNWAFREKHDRGAVVLENSEAERLGMKSPCVYVKLRYVDRLFFPIYNKSLRMENFVHRSRFGKKVSKVFREQHYPGSRITKRPKKKNGKNN